MEQQATPAPIPSPFTCDTFAPHIGETFSIPIEGGGTFDLELVEANPARLQPYDGRVLGKSGYVRRDPFVLLFRGPATTMLAQGTYRFQHPVVGEFMMSVVPVGPGEVGLLYESVFN